MMHVQHRSMISEMFYLVTLLHYAQASLNGSREPFVGKIVILTAPSKKPLKKNRIKEPHNAAFLVFLN